MAYEQDDFIIYCPNWDTSEGRRGAGTTGVNHNCPWQTPPQRPRSPHPSGSGPSLSFPLAHATSVFFLFTREVQCLLSASSSTSYTWSLRSPRCLPKPPVANSAPPWLVWPPHCFLHSACPSSHPRAYLRSWPQVLECPLRF